VQAIKIAFRLCIIKTRVPKLLELAEADAEKHIHHLTCINV
jgi:hypothetical protein